MTFRFNTWVEADSPKEAWEKLRLSLEDKRLGDKLKDIFSVCLLEDGDEDKENRLVEELKQKDEKYHGLVEELIEKYKALKEELTVRELFEWCLRHEDCEGCKPKETGYGCPIQPGIDIERLTSIVRGYKPEGEER